ncbi:hypothetical protein QN277_011184 [Acacia crassicarpa]|uniref:Uncharacterized protein n=1 Tax=Acacia crassicarpa TaxID=499986 RepID=A0AAE1MY52_9FABA|nr:hypothetical protein QN277_011184 [Acacia crassicarpa]
METPSGVRKGTWSKEEDDLLRACVQRYGEGKWHLVPQRAALNRCRKSCRLRWLNYLKPGIKRGNFSEDEADMIMRFHRLLGNRWSLIAARFPGRTSNDVKNYWNSHIRKKLRCSFTENNKEKQVASSMRRHQVIMPQPTTLSRNYSSRTRKELPEEEAVVANTYDNSSGRRYKPIIASDSDNTYKSESDEALLVADSAEMAKEWCESLLDDFNKGNEEDNSWCLGEEEHSKFLAQFWDHDLQLDLFQ